MARTPTDKRYRVYRSATGEYLFMPPMRLNKRLRLLPWRAGFLWPKSLSYAMRCVSRVTRVPFYAGRFSRFD